METKQTWIFALIALIITSGVLMAREQSPEVPIAGATAFEIPKDDMKVIEARALAGDCDAALRIGRHHSFFTINEAETIKWFRVAAKCPDARVKSELVIHLMTGSGSAHVADEVAELLDEIRELDPKFAVEFEREVERLRSRK